MPNVKLLLYFWQTLLLLNQEKNLFFKVSIIFIKFFHERTVLRWQLTLEKNLKRQISLLDFFVFIFHSVTEIRKGHQKLLISGLYSNSNMVGVWVSDHTYLVGALLMLLCFCPPTLAVGRANGVKRIKDTLNPFYFALLRLRSKVI